MVSANLRGPGQRWLRRLNNSEVQDCIFDITHDGLVTRMNKAAAASVVGTVVPVTFSPAINAMKVAKFLRCQLRINQLLVAHSPTMCLIYPTFQSITLILSFQEHQRR